MATTPKLLKKADLDKKFKRLSEWTLNAKQTELSRIIPTSTYISGLALIARIAVHAEILNHHPIIEFAYNSVKVKITTHELKGLTNTDFELAQRIDTIHSADDRRLQYR